MKTFQRPESPLAHPRIVRLSARFRFVRTRFARGALRCIIELGQILSDGRRIVSGQYGRWLQDLEIGHTTADRYVAICELHRQDPASVEACLPLGSRALHRLTRLSPEGMRVVREQATTIKSGHDLLRVTAPYVRVYRTVPARSRVARLCKSVKHCTEQIEEIRTMKLPDPRECKMLEHDLAAIAAEAHRGLRVLARAKRRKRAA